MSNLKKHVKKDKAKWVATTIVLVVLVAVVGGLLYSVISGVAPQDWFPTDDSVVDDNLTPDDGGDELPDNGGVETPDNSGDVVEDGGQDLPDNGGDVVEDGGENIPDNGGENPEV